MGDDDDDDDDDDGGGGVVKGDDGVDEDEGEVIYELHHEHDCHHRCYSGDEEILDHLQSRTVVGVRDDYEFWRDNNQAPWSGKPVWARGGEGGSRRRKGGGDRSSNSHRLLRRRRPMRHDHHHILLDDNIHNDPNDGIGAVRVPVPVEETDEFDDNDDNDNDTNVVDEMATSYVSLRGKGALEMHGRHLIRVPTLRPLLEDDWFVRRIEDARWRIFDEEKKEEEEEEGVERSHEIIIDRKVT